MTGWMPVRRIYGVPGGLDARALLPARSRVTSARAATTGFATNESIDRERHWSVILTSARDAARVTPWFRLKGRGQSVTRRQYPEHVEGDGYAAHDIARGAAGGDRSLPHASIRECENSSGRYFDACFLRFATAAAVTLDGVDPKRAVT